MNSKRFTDLKSQIATSSKLSQTVIPSFKHLGGAKPLAFTEQGIFYNGQVFDAYTFAADLIRSAKKSLVLIDNYIDDSMFTLFSKRKKGAVQMLGELEVVR